MSNHLLSILKPLVFEGKSGILQITHAYNDQALFYLKEGMIEQVVTSKLQGEKAVKLVRGWVSITNTFFEDKQGHYSPTLEIGTAAILALLEKSSKNIAIIQKKIPDNSSILQINSNKLNSVKTLSTEDLKVAVLYDGTRSIEQAMEVAGKSELALLTHTCRLIMAGVAKTRVIQKEVMPEEERIFLLHSLTETLTQAIGMAAPIFMDDAFEEIKSQPDRLSKEEIPSLLAALRGMLDDDEERAELDQWEGEYLGTA